MSKPAEFHSVDKVLLYAVGLLLSTLMAILIAQGSETKTIVSQNHDHTISADIKLSNIQVEASGLTNEISKVKRQLSTVCITQKKYWPEHAEDCY